MSTSAIYESTSASSYTSSYANATYSGVDDSQFMQLLLAQLTHQNPLDPMDDGEFMGQLTQINMLNELKDLNEAITNFSSSTQFTNATNLIGKTVKITTSDGVYEDVCDGVTLSGDIVYVWFDNYSVSLDSVIGVSAEEDA